MQPTELIWATLVSIRIYLALTRLGWVGYYVHRMGTFSTSIKKYWGMLPDYWGIYVFPGLAPMVPSIHQPLLLVEQ